MIIDLGGRYRNAFGFIASNQSDRLQKLGFAEKTGIADVPVYVTGNTSFEQLELYGNGFNLIFGDALLSKEGNLGKVFAPPLMISYSRGKKITETSIDDSDAAVVERYGKESWQIKIQGLLIDMENHIYPSSQVRKIREVFDVDAPFNVSAQIFDDLDIKSIYFTNIELAGVQGYVDTFSYNLDARSIKPVEYFLVNKK